ncbi:MAG: sensor histidine kinase [Verrucomicrobiota bacterium]
MEVALRESELRQCNLLNQSARQKEQLRTLSHRILKAREEERKRISRELHDDISQTLIGISIQLQTLAMAAKANPQLLGAEIARTQQLVERSVNIVHEFARSLRPASLDDLGLTVTLKMFLEDFMKQTGIRVQFTTFAGVDQLDNDRLTALYRIVQAALANVIEHSNSTLVTVGITQIEDAVNLEIFDNGTAFDVRRVQDSMDNKHLGLVDMQERTEMLGGQFTIESEPNKGTTIQARIPLAG